jgi:hypothetical protein
MSSALLQDIPNKLQKLITLALALVQHHQKQLE